MLILFSAKWEKVATEVILFVGVVFFTKILDFSFMSINIFSDGIIRTTFYYCLKK